MHVCINELISLDTLNQCKMMHKTLDIYLKFLKSGRLVSIEDPYANEFLTQCLMKCHKSYGLKNLKTCTSEFKSRWQIYYLVWKYLNFLNWTTIEQTLFTWLHCNCQNLTTTIWWSYDGFQEKKKTWMPQNLCVFLSYFTLQKLNFDTHLVLFALIEQVYDWG